MEKQPAKDAHLQRLSYWLRFSDGKVKRKGSPFVREYPPLHGLKKKPPAGGFDRGGGHGVPEGGKRAY